METERTLGRLARRSRIWLESAGRYEGLYPARRGSVPTGYKFEQTKPVVSCCRFNKLRANKPAPVNNTIESPTCNTTIADERLRLRKRLRVRAFSFMAVARSVLLARIAGIKPNKTPAIIETPTRSE